MPRLVEGKSAVARVFARWKKHDDVDAGSQVKDFMADIKVSGGGSNGESRVTVMRPDQIPEASKKRDPSGFNFFHTPSATADYEAVLTPTPQSNNSPVEYTLSQDSAWRHREKASHQFRLLLSSRMADGPLGFRRQAKPTGAI
jgi:hypothetical protein